MPCVLEQLLCREAHTAIDTASVESRKAQEPAAIHVVLTRAYHRMHATAVTAPANVNTLQVPQLIENYKSGSADGISLVFLAIWFFILARAGRLARAPRVTSGPPPFPP